MLHLRRPAALVCLLSAAAIILTLLVCIAPLPIPPLDGSGTDLPLSASSQAHVQLSAPVAKAQETALNADAQQAIQRILSHYQVHRCVHTLTGLSDAPESCGIRLSSSAGELSFPDRCHIRIDATVYRVGWLGSYQGQKLMDELSWALRLNQTHLST